MKKVANLSKSRFITENQAKSIANKALHMQFVRIDSQQVMKKIPSNFNSLEYGYPIKKVS